MKKIYIIVILFNPTIEQFSNKLRKFNGCELIFIDNTPRHNIELAKMAEGVSHVTYVELGDNRGIATAQNIGLKLALEQGATHILFFDQDSEITSEYAEKIVKEYDRLRSTGVNIGILGPRIINMSNQEEYKSKFHTYNSDENGFTEMPSIMSSGSVVDRKFVNDVGGLDNSLFIDFVDHEWGWRAIQYGYRIGETNNLILRHKVGCGDFKLGKYRAAISAPFRYFYQCRNFVWLSQRDYVPMHFKIKTPIHYLIHTILYPFMVKNGCKIVYQMWRGLFNGLFTQNKPNFNINV